LLTCRNERGAALVTAVIAATIVFLLAGAALNIAMGRFQLATAQTIRRAAFYASEAGIRYGFARLDADQPNNACEGQNDTSIKDKTKLCSGLNPYKISSKSGVGAHEVKPELKMGNFDVTVTITYQPANPPSQPTERWKVTAVAQ
jgi:Tfp pilus assembly protein PilX